MRLFFPLSGDDVFISYSRRDENEVGRRYAVNLYNELKKNGFSSFMDHLGTEPSPTQPESLNQKIRNSKMLIIVGTERACQSTFVEGEIIEFLKSRRIPIVPIDFSGIIPKARWYPLVEGVTLESESPETLKSGIPSSGVITRIEEAFQYTKRNEQLRRATIGTLSILTVLILAIIGAAIFAGIQVSAAIKANADAEKATTLANDKTEEANKATIRANSESNRANSEAINANKQAEIANTKTEEANKATKLAEEKNTLAQEKTKLAEEKTKIATLATKQADIANEEANKQTEQAKKQQGIAEALELANNSSQKLQEGPLSLKESLSSAIQSVQRASEFNTQLIESDIALRRSLALTPLVLFPEIEIAIANKTVALSPDGKLIAILKSDNHLQINDTEDFKIGEGEEGQLINKEFIVADAKFVAVNNTAKKIVSANLNEIQIYDLEVGRISVIKREDFSIDGLDNVHRVAISPTGKYLAFIIGSGDADEAPLEGSEHNISKAVFWDVENDKKLATITGNLNFELTSVAFGAHENVLAVGGGSFNGASINLGYSILWDLEAVFSTVEVENEKPNKLDKKDIWKTAFDKNIVVINHDDFVKVIAPGKDINQFTTVSSP